MPRRSNAGFEGSAARKIDSEATAPEIREPKRTAGEALREGAALARRREREAQERAEADAALAEVQAKLESMGAAAEAAPEVAKLREQEKPPLARLPAGQASRPRQAVLTESAQRFRAAAEEKTRALEMQERLEAVRDEKMEARLALTEAARIQTQTARRAIETNQLTDENSWEFLHQLRNRELELEAALTEAWRRPEEDLQLEPSIEERHAVINALHEVQGTLGILRDKIEAGHAQADFENTYLAARTAAFERYAADAARARDVREGLAEGRLDTLQRRRYADLFRDRITALESGLAKLDKLSPEKAAEFENAAAYEAASETLKDLREVSSELTRVEQESLGPLQPKTTEELERELRLAEPEAKKIERPKSRGQQLSDLYSSVDRVTKNLEDMAQRGALTDEWREQSLIELSKAYADLEDHLHYLQTEALDIPANRAERARIAETLHRIDGTRAALHARPLEEGEEVPISVRDRLLEKELKAKTRELADIERRSATLAKQVKKLYGREPEDVLAGGLGLGGFLKRSVARLAGQADPYGEWQELARRADILRTELGPAYVGREVTPEARAKMRVRGAVEEVEQRRFEDRQAARDYREAQWLPKPATEEEFFGGALEEPRAEIETAADMRVKAVLQEAAQRGVAEAQTVYRNLMDNPAVELLSFAPDEYIQQLGIVAEARHAQGGKKGRERFAAKKRLKAAQDVLSEMQTELLEYGFDPETGGALRGGRSLESPGVKDIKRRKETAARRQARRKTGAGSVFFEA